jgi:hypothetical protein
MIERKVPATTYMIEAGCACGGSLIFTGMVQTQSIPPMHLHRCDRCPNTENLRETYPQFRVEKIDKPSMAVVHTLRLETPPSPSSEPPEGGAPHVS